MVARSIKRFLLTAFAATGVGLVLVALFLLARAVQNADDFNRLYDVLIAINVAGVVVLFAFLVGNLTRLVRDYRTHVPGAKLKGRIVGMFVGLAIVPLLVVFYFAMQFINRGIDSWFNVQIDSALNDALELSRASLDVRMRELLRQTQVMSNSFNSGSNSGNFAALTLDDLRFRGGPARSRR